MQGTPSHRASPWLESGSTGAADEIRHLFELETKEFLREILAADGVVENANHRRDIIEHGIVGGAEALL